VIKMMKMRDLSALALVIVCGLLAWTPRAQAQDEGQPLSWRASLDQGVKARQGEGVAGVRLDFLGQTLLGVQSAQGQPTSQSWTLLHVRPGANIDVEAPGGAPLHLFFQGEFAGSSAALLDAQTEWRPAREFGLLVGRYRPITSRGWGTGLMALAMPGRGAVQDTFHPGRAVGATVRGELGQGTWEYALGALDAGSLDKTQERLPTATARLVWNPLGPTPYTQNPWFSGLDGPRLAVGLNGYASQAGPLGEDGQRQATGGADLTLFFSRVAWLTEVFARRQDGSTGGAYSQVSLLLVPQTLDLSLRAGVLEQRQVLEGSLGWYLEGNHAKVMLHYQMDAQEVDDAPETRSHQVNLFAQLWL
jgi:hypothetical protein